MATSSTEIRNEIEQSQKRLATTVEAIGYKADIGPRAREAVQEKKERALQPLKRTKDKIAAPLRRTRDVAGSGASRVRSSIPDPGHVTGAGRRAGQTLKEDPNMLAAASLGAGIVLGLLVKLRQKEVEVLSPAAQKVRMNARQASEKALDRGKRLADQIPNQASAAAARATQQAATKVVKKAKRAGDKSAEKTQRLAQKAPRAAASKTPRGRTAGTANPRSRTAGTSTVARRASGAAARTRRRSADGPASARPSSRSRSAGRG